MFPGSTTEICGVACVSHFQHILPVDAHNKLGTINWTCSAGTKLWAIGKLLREMQSDGMLCFRPSWICVLCKCCFNLSEEVLYVLQFLVCSQFFPAPALPGFAYLSWIGLDLHCMCIATSVTTALKLTATTLWNQMKRGTDWNDFWKWSNGVQLKNRRNNPVKPRRKIQDMWGGAQVVCQMKRWRKGE